MIISSRLNILNILPKERLLLTILKLNLNATSLLKIKRNVKNYLKIDIVIFILILKEP